MQDEQIDRGEIMKIKFKKMHGAGNDFVVMTYANELPKDLENLSKSMCDRHFGVGADGFMIAAPSENADIKMIFYNADGTVAEMCGNGVRCFSRYVFEEGLVEDTNFVVETLAGPQGIQLTEANGRVESVRVVMGKAHLNAVDIPVLTNQDVFTDVPVVIDTLQLELTSMRIGVPHTMIFDSLFDQKTVNEIGPKVEKHELFPENTNVNFVDIIDRKNIRIATWERGAGPTLACGTGACASFYAAFRKNLVDDSITVSVPGGKLQISKNDKDEIIMEGNAVLVAEGYYYYK